MARKKTVAVIGIGRFGAAVCEELVKLGSDVLAIDKSEEAINQVKNIVNHSVICDSTKKENLWNVGVNSVDNVIVGIGQNVEDSILTTLLLMEIGVQNISVKVENEYHAKIVERLGATEIIKPEETIGKRTARKILFSEINDYVDLSNEFGIFEIEATPSILNIPLMDLDVRNKHSINISAVRRDNSIFIPKADDVLLAGDILVIIGENKKVTKFMQFIKK